MFSAFRSAPRCTTLFLCLFFSSLALGGCGDGTPDYTPEELAEATAQVREAYYAQDNYYGVELGEKWGSVAPEALELRAWTVANLILTRLEGGEPKRMAEEMVASHPDSPWSWFALAHVIAWEFPYQNREEAMGASERALAGLPGNPDPLILHAEVLRRYADRDSALAFLDGLPEPIRGNLDIRAFKPFRLPPPVEERSEAYFESVIESYEGVLAENPDHLLANYGIGRLLKGIE